MVRRFCSTYAFATATEALIAPRAPSPEPNFDTDIDEERRHNGDDDGGHDGDEGYEGDKPNLESRARRPSPACHDEAHKIERDHAEESEENDGVD